MYKYEVKEEYPNSHSLSVISWIYPIDSKGDWHTDIARSLAQDRFADTSDFEFNPFLAKTRNGSNWHIQVQFSLSIKPDYSIVQDKILRAQRHFTGLIEQIKAAQKVSKVVNDATEQKFRQGG